MIALKLKLLGFGLDIRSPRDILEGPRGYLRDSLLA